MFFVDDSPNLEESNPKLLKNYGDIPLTPKMMGNIQLKEIIREEKYKAKIRRKRK